MKFSEVLKSFENGSKIRRRCWDEGESVSIKSSSSIYGPDILQDDWEVVGLNFLDALNALLIDHKLIRRFGFRRRQDAICYRDGKLYKGLGTCGVSEYKFTTSDIAASDWLIES